MTTTTHNRHNANYEQAREELREGIETSREIVRQSRILIELSECDRGATNDNESSGINS